RTVTRRFAASGGGIVRPPLDDTGEPADDFTIDDHGHLCETARCWQCPACETWRCRACGVDGRLDTCTTCKQPACGECRRRGHTWPAAAVCGVCGARSCGDCGRDIQPSLCVLCRTTVCNGCRSGALCTTCDSLRPATSDEIAALPASLVADDLDVRISRDAHVTVVALSGATRREIALVRDGRVVNWWRAVEMDDAEMQFRLATGASTRLGDVAVVFERPLQPPEHADPSMVISATTAIDVAWSVHDRSDRRVGGSEERCTASGLAERELVEGLA